MYGKKEKKLVFFPLQEKKNQHFIYFSPAHHNYLFIETNRKYQQVINKPSSENFSNDALKKYKDTTTTCFFLQYLIVASVGRTSPG